MRALLHGGSRGLRAFRSSLREAARLHRLSARPFAESVETETAGPSGGFSGRTPLLVGAAAIVAAGGLAAAAVLRHSVDVNLKPISEEVFEVADNLFVIFLDSHQDLVDRQQDIQRVLRVLVEHPQLSNVKFHYNVRKEGDPTIPVASEGEGLPTLKAVMYKGQRKSPVALGQEIPLDEVLAFFEPRSEDPAKVPPQPPAVSRVVGSNFQELVIEASTTSHPVLLQMFEDTCFLCFLMRPFINAVAELLKEQGVPVTIKRLNIEVNDFPSGCPVARGTPTFVLFRGPTIPPTKWEEFKPKDFSEKLVKTFGMSPPTVAQLEELQNLVATRFQLFTQLVMWTSELQRLEELLAAANDALASGKSPPATPSKPDDDAFNEVVSAMMALDMRRTDSIRDNLLHLQREVDEVEHDAALMGSMLAEVIRRREEKELE